MTDLTSQASASFADPAAPLDALVRVAAEHKGWVSVSLGGSGMVRCSLHRQGKWVVESAPVFVDANVDALMAVGKAASQVVAAIGREAK